MSLDGMRRRSTPAPASARRALIGASAGQFIEFYDFALYGTAAVVLSELFFPADDPVASLLVTFAIFGAAFAVRPLGGLVFGVMGDRIGRRRVLVTTLSLIGASTTLIGLLPTYSAIGWVAPLMLVCLRLLQGFSAGGESAGAITFVFEHAPIDRRGLWVAICMAATALPAVVASVLFVIVEGSAGPDAFLQWGWRIPFLLALPLSAIGFWLRSRTSESAMFLKSRAASATDRSTEPPRRRQDVTRIVQIVAVMALTSLTFYMFSAYFVNSLQSGGMLDRRAALAINAVALVLMAVAAPIAGGVSDRVGRRRVLFIGGCLIAVAAIPSFLLLESGSVVLALVGQSLFGLSVAVFAGGAFVFYAEAFATRHRLTSVGISYNLTYALFGGTAPFVALTLVSWTGDEAAPGYYVALVAAFAVLTLAASRVPESSPGPSARIEAGDGCHAG